MMPISLVKTKKLIWPEIDKYLKDPVYPVQFQISPKYLRDVNLYWKINKDYPTRKGKYLRPALVILIARAMGVDNSLLRKTAAAMQLSEEWVLIHDDVEDKSIIRRGKPTLHKIYGEELAINAGDALGTIMWKKISDLKSNRLINEFYKILMRTILGQSVEQIWINQKRGSITKDDYFFISDSKSAYYTIAGPMRLGAIVADAKASQIEKITDFGLHLGRCFQLIDDILDITQDQKEGKVTLAIVKGSSYCKKLAVKEKQTAEKIFDKELKFLSKEPARTELKELINFILERRY